MNGKSESVTVSIFGKDYKLRSGSDQEYIKTLAAHVDSVMHDISTKMGVNSPGRVAVLAALNIVDEMYKERQDFRKLTDELSRELEEVLNMESDKPGTDA